LTRDGAGGEVQERAADESGHVLADVEGVQVDNDDLPCREQLAEIDSRARLTDDLPSDAAAHIFVDLGLDGVDDLELVAAFERLEIALEPLAVTGSLVFFSTWRRKPGRSSTAGTSRMVCWASRPWRGSWAHIPSLASNSARVANRKASSMRGPQ
jgi:hypothetical protein